MSCPYAQLDLAIYDSKALVFTWSPATWEIFCGDLFVVWTHGSITLNLFLITSTIKVTLAKSSVQVTADNGPDFLDLKLIIAEGKININVYSKPTNSFSCICNIPKGIALIL